MVRLRGLVLILLCCLLLIGAVCVVAVISIGEAARIAGILPASAYHVTALSISAMLAVLWAGSRVVPTVAASAPVGSATPVNACNVDVSRAIAASAHELQTPISAILGAATLLADSGLDAQQARHVENVRTAARNLLALVGNVLELSRLDAGTIELGAETIDLDALLSRLYVASTDATRGLLVRVVGVRDPAAPQYVVADRQRLTQVLLILIAHVAATRGAGTINVRACLSTERLCFRLGIEGLSIGKEERARLLLPFRSHGEDVPAAAAGLQLAICRRLVLLMGGKMDAEIPRGDDCLLAFHLPLVSATAPPPETPEQTLTHDPAPRVLDVMVADDTPSTLHVMTLLLRRQGHHVTPVTNGADAISTAQARAFDLCLLDLRMARVGGIDAAIGIRALPAPFGTGAIYALSARIDADNRRACHAARMDGCFVKPLLGDELAALLDRVAHRRPKADFTLQGAH